MANGLSNLIEFFFQSFCATQTADNGKPATDDSKKINYFTSSVWGGISSEEKATSATAYSRTTTIIVYLYQKNCSSDVFRCSGFFPKFFWKKERYNKR